MEPKNSIGFNGALLLIFIGLKVAGFIDWSWWWVLSPIWISIAIVALVILFAFLFSKK
jgi:hypothetical protein